MIPNKNSIFAFRVLVSQSSSIPHFILWLCLCLTKTWLRLCSRKSSLCLALFLSQRSQHYFGRSGPTGCPAFADELYSHVWPTKPTLDQSTDIGVDTVPSNLHTFIARLTPTAPQKTTLRGPRIDAGIGNNTIIICVQLKKTASMQVQLRVSPD